MNWIPYDKQKPTREDANSDGDVLWTYKDGKYNFPEVSEWTTEWAETENLHWLSIPDYPGAKSKDEQDLAEFNEWWNAVPPKDCEVDSHYGTALEAWLAARKR